MTTTKRDGSRVYELLIPVPTRADAAKHHSAVVLQPITYSLERDWEDGQIDGQRGMLDALMRRIARPFEAVEDMRHPDTGFFIAEFMMHLPPLMRESISTGRLPTPTAPSSPVSADYPPQSLAPAGEARRPAGPVLPGDETVHEWDAASGEAEPDMSPGGFEPNPEAGSDDPSSIHPFGIEP